MALKYIYKHAIFIYSTIKYKRSILRLKVNKWSCHGLTGLTSHYRPGLVV